MERSEEWSEGKMSDWEELSVGVGRRAEEATEAEEERELDEEREAWESEWAGMLPIALCLAAWRWRRACISRGR